MNSLRIPSTTPSRRGIFTPAVPTAPARPGHPGTSVRSNAEWVAGLRGGDPNAELLAELRAYLRGTLARAFSSRNDIQDSDLDDIEQDALLRILSRLDDFRGDSRFTTWATAVAIRIALTAIRRRRSRSQAESDVERATLRRDAEGRGVVQDPVRTVTRRSLLTTLDYAINNSLTERQRLVIQGRLEGAHSEELAARLGTNRNALHKLYHDARKSLKRAINAAGFSDEDVRDELLSTVAAA